MIIREYTALPTTLMPNAIDNASSCIFFCKSSIRLSMRRNAAEALAVKTDTVTAPEYVREMVVDTENENHEIVIKVYLKGIASGLFINSLI
jgi:hypothetical protein